MATFDEKEFLWDDMYSSVKALIHKKKGIDESSSQERISDFRALRQFRRNIGKKNPEEIDFDEAMNFYRDMENKYKLMPNKW